jgi:hypothetical protein
MQSNIGFISAIFKPKRIINQKKAIFFHLFEPKTKPILNKNIKKRALIQKFGIFWSNNHTFETNATKSAHKS